MILHKLYELYDRLEKDESYDVAPEGFSLVTISFIIELELDGSCRILDHRIGEGSNRHGQIHRVPGPKAHTNRVTPFPLRDTSAYLLGCVTGDTSPENVKKRFEASRHYHLAIRTEIDTAETRAVCGFFERWDPKQAANLDPKILANSGAFKMRNSQHFVFESKEIEEWWKRTQAELPVSDEPRQCLITGMSRPIAETHTPPVGGSIPGAQTKATIVSFNFPSARSYGYSEEEERGLNAPVSTEAATHYCKALNALLHDPRHNLRSKNGTPILIGDASTVFWTEKQTKLESSVTRFFSGTMGSSESPEDRAQDEALLQRLQSCLTALGSGTMPRIQMEGASTPFHILGLTAQAGGRVGVRFWNSGTLGDLVLRLSDHHSNLALARPRKNKMDDPVGYEFPSPWKLLEQTGRDSKSLPANLARGLMSAIINGSPYPESLPQLVINRIRTDRSIDPCCWKDKALDTFQAKEQAYYRAAILKAWLIRNHKQQIHMTYDPHKKDVAYRLGALFALLEKTQQDALGDINAGVRDRYYSSASATPASVFPRMFRTYTHHLAKAASENPGYKKYRETDVQTVLAEPEPIACFPNHLNLQDQGLFAIGYYHKRKDLWTKRNPDSQQPKSN